MSCWFGNCNTKTCDSPCCACERESGSPTPTPASDPAPPVDAIKHQNYERAEQGLHIILQVLTIYAKDLIKAYHTSLLTKETTAADGTSRTTLCELPACTRHTRTPEDKTKGPSINELLACPSCKPWIEALGAAHESKKPKRINVRQPHTPITTAALTHISTRFAGLQPVSCHMARPCTWTMAHSHLLHTSWVSR